MPLEQSVGANKTWNGAQSYEFDAARAFMETPYFSDLMTRNKKLREERSSTLNMEVLFHEFFQGEQKKLDQFVESMKGKNCLEIGPSCATVLGSWWFSSRNYVIEPLFDKIKKYQNERFGYSMFDETINYSCPAEDLIPELVGKIDGAVVCRNCIDHTPNWAFILSNMVSYMAPGATLLIWNDIYHPDGVDDGHYNITDNIDNYKRLLKNFGLAIDYEFSYDMSQRPTLNYGCVARKTTS